MASFTSIIVDDEWLVRKELKTMLQQFPEIEVIEEAANVPQALELLTKYKPDVIFLDIQMPGATGFDLLERTNITSKIIFITAYDQYALKAFEVNALDYLLKPIQKERLGKAMQRLFSHEKPTTQPDRRFGYDDIIYVLVNGSLKFLKISLIKCIVAEGNYSYIYYKDREKNLVSKTLQEWERVLPENYFIRIHRSTIVNFEYVERIKKCRNYTNLIYLKGIEKPFIMSRRYATKLKNSIAW